MGRLHAIKSFYDQQIGGLVTLEDDVLSIVRQVNELYDHRVAVNLDPITGWYHFTEHCEDGNERLIFSTEALDARALERLQKADSQSRGHEDSYEAVEREQDELQAELDRKKIEALHEPMERLVRAMKQEGIDDRAPLVSVPLTGRRRRADS